MNKLDISYQNLLKDILENGTEKNTRNGKTLSVFGRQIRHKMSEGFPALTTKKLAFKTMVVELLWFLRGDTNIKYLVDNDCHIWDGDAYKNYLHKVIRDKDIVRYLKSYSIDTNGVPTIELYSKDEFIERIKTDDEFAKKWGSLGKIYGHGWRNWGGDNFIHGDFRNGIDQIQNLIDELKTNPDSRRMIVSAWAVHDLSNMVLPPCHYGFQVYTRELSAIERTAIGSKGSTKLYDSIKEGGYETIDADVEMHKVCDDANVPKRAISLMFNMRSTDVPLGLPFNIASYGLLLEILAKEVNMVPDELIANLGDAHIYSNQIDGVKEQLTREPFELSQLSFLDEYHYLHDVELVGNLSFVEKIEEFRPDFFKLVNYQSHPTIKLPLSN